MILYRVFFATTKQVQQTVRISVLPEQQTLWNNSLVDAGMSAVISELQQTDGLLETTGLSQFWIDFDPLPK